jgi:hypothetical protein
MKNWKTTLCGIIAGGLLSVQAIQSHKPMDLMFAFAIGALGILAKDCDKTGT